MRKINLGRRYCEREMADVVQAAKAYVGFLESRDNSVGVESLLAWEQMLTVQQGFLKRAVKDLAAAEFKIAGSPRPRESANTHG